ncbi:DMT family transporter [Nocardia sp. NPDC046763]|uniref:DMT family transporter n=1 Tax=Nocardia sp. NPDC046763 TaxID=3155256 RepID=UPI0033F998A1
MTLVAARRRITDDWVPKFLVLSAIWGTSFALIKLAVNADVPAVWVALWRCGFGALALAVICAVSGEGLPRSRSVWGHAAVVAVLLNAAPFTLLAVAEQHISSVLAGLINATTPIMTMGFAMVLVPGEPLTRRRAAGVLIGLAGVACLLGVWRGLSADTVGGVAACLAATMCYGAGFAYTRRFFSSGGGSAAALSLTQLVAATVELAVVAALTGSASNLPGWAAAVGLIVLGTIGTGYAFLLNMQVIASAGATIASTITYVVPIWSTALGALFFSEPVGWNSVVGGLVIVGGIVVARTQPRRSAAAPAP